MIEEIITRKSIRKYKDTPVDDSLIMQVLEAARLAPSGSNTQPWHFIVIKSPEMRQLVQDTADGQKWLAHAPVHIAVVADIRVRIKDEQALPEIDELSPQFEVKQIIRDTSVAIAHIMLEARHVGLDTCWIGSLTQATMRPALGVPNDKFIVGIITLGYGDEAGYETKRKPMADILHSERW